MKKIRKIFISLLAVISVIILTACQVSDSNTDESEELTKIDFILDWVPNTNHTGLFVALENGYFEEAGLDVTIRRPPEGSATELVATGEAQFGIDFQDILANRFEQDIPVTVVSTIIDHNTSGIISNEDLDITDAAEMAGHSYGTWNEDIELALVEHIVEVDGGDFSEVELVPNQADNSVIGLANEMFDSAWIYYAWDGVMADYQDVPTNFFYLTDYAEELDFYSPVIVANNDYIADNPEETRAMVQAIKKGYQFAMENPEEAADILIKHAPELEDQRDFVVASQEWISSNYAASPDEWGRIDEVRWNAFYNWLYENDLVSKDLTGLELFTNEFLGD